MRFEETAILDVFLVVPKRHGDARGYFMETFRQDYFEAAVGPHSFIQDNQSFSAEKGTIRGLHFQLEPKAQGKLVRCVAGALLDVAVDIRKGSPTFGHHVAVELTEENNHQLWIPPGFAHGFCTLSPNTVINYKVTEYYSAAEDRGLKWDDPVLGIKWPVDSASAILSDKDRKQPALDAMPDSFTYRK
ncbi:dTDP-4-dehydrorhamnose 3,5-epimerase [Agrobacterium larrymoorei]|uniref:dTDP-4-dehydrorhamnose 3,5-epimerase n=1 Tax=Agrobacterium larrymoorei TaxID=160699 RepID=UPI001572DEEB|nr:dTDP-4-dehydrorhamnose 3,5-epimerase [Agrobacterium larrymoorei]NTJ43936.1 dTDP-4-dehydrorhamnose 3,5-epimerase [Agrobacterium larrymoorei]